MEYKHIHRMKVRNARRKMFLLMAMLLSGSMASAQVFIKGNVFGGCELGEVKVDTEGNKGNTAVTINGGTIGDKIPLADRKVDENGQVKRIRYGNVYGGGNGYDGTDYSQSAPSIDRNLGRVQGNTSVTIKGDAVVRHAVYGGGNLGTVGVCTINDDGTTATYTTGGKTTVTIEGNALIGPTKADLTKDDEGNDLTQPVIDTAFKYLGGNEGMVFGGSQGLSGDEVKELSFVDTTEVIIRGNVTVAGNVFGGSENGHVQKGTSVLIQGSAVIGGIPLLGGTGDYAYPYTVPEGSKYAGALIQGGVNELYEDDYGVGRRVFRGNVFGGGKGTDFVPWLLGQEPPVQQYSYTSGDVYGNATVQIQGGTVYNKVYGGGTIASVGTFQRTDTNNPHAITGIVQKDEKDTGHCFVTITGGQIGTNSYNNGEVYGGGRGVVGRVREEGEPLLPIHQAIDLAYVGHTHVTIDGAVIKSSVYGGSANGHVQGNTKVLIKETTPNTTYIGTAGLGAWHSNVYGGGGGTARYTMMETPSGGGTPVPVKHLSITSGRVFGDTEVEITGGKVLHNVYGGGAIASVGTYNASNLVNPEYPYIGGGHAKVTITGGEIGTDGNNNGMVFGSGRGQIAEPGNFLDYVTYVAYSEVNIGTGTVNQTTGVVSGISGDAKIKGSVYGSGENGHVYLESVVNVFAGTIGCDLDEYKSYANPSSPTYDATWKTTKFPYRGNVYGAGCGTDEYGWETLKVPGTEPPTPATYPGTTDPIKIGKYNPLAGITQGNTKVNIYGGYISRSVYGGGAMASVGLYSVGEPHEDPATTFALSWPYEFEYSDIYDANHAAVTTGKTEVTVTGGHIGTYCDDDWDNLYALGNSGDVFGGSRGMVGDRYYFVKYANVKESVVSINYSNPATTPTAGGNFIVNSVFGGGENGHVYENTQVTIDDGLIGGTVFGGGKGKDTYWDYLKSWDGSAETYYLTQVHSITAGKVFGNTEVTMNNGVVQHNVFGGGEYASVGKGNYIGYGEMTSQASGGPAYSLTDHAGRCVVTIKGGTIGTNGYHDQYNINNGSVYGSSKGVVYPTVDQKPGSARYDYSRDFFLGYANKTEVTIGDATVATTPAVKGSVFGGGEDGHVRWHTDVTVNKGTIGVECVAEAYSTTDEWLYRGNVYGAGRGIDKIASGLPHAGEYCSSAGSVTLNTTVTVNGGTIYRNVYGGGSMASVGPPPVANSTYNPGTSRCQVNVYGGTIGTIVFEGETNEYLYGGDVFGAGRGNLDIATTDNIGRYASAKASEAHLYTGGHIRGTLYGGGEIGQVKSNSFAYVDGGTADNNVYGAGKGVLTDEKAALVLGNSTVDMTGGHVIGSVYGGGELGNVGTYIDPANPTSSDPNLPYYTAEELLLPANAGHVLGEPKGCTENTGLASVYIKGGRVGQEGGEKMPTPSSSPDDNVYGYVFAGGCGALVDTTGGQNPKANLLGIVGSTYLEISQTGETAPVITASVYGGCENGLVLGNTHVKIMAGQIGTGYRGGNNWDPAYTDAQWADAIDAVNAGTIGTTYSNPFHECDAFPYQAPYAVYDIYAGTTGYDAQGGSTQGSNGHSFFGNVFGGGSGYYPIKPGVWRRSAGRVWGDTHVEITGGHILTSVYGGNETTDVMGTCTVEMKGGTIGVPRTYDQIHSHPVTCYLFGAGTGDERVMFNTWTNVASTVVSVTGGTIFGSVFGGGEDGHVFGDAEVNIGQDAGKETLIGTLGYSYVDGNVFGGGRGYNGNALTAGVVKGNVTMTIGGGTMLGSIYGGGRLASVGTYLVPAEIDDPSNPGTMIHNPTYGQLIPDGSSTDTHGHITMTISGGTIGNDYTGPIENKGGNVFAGGMGRLEQIDGTTLNTQWPNLAKVKKTNLTITNGTIKGSVYGGGELGTVYEDAVISIEGGTIMRDVFGGGHGSDIIDAAHNGNLYVLTGSSTATTTVVNPAQWAGLVKNNTQLTLSSTGTVKGSMYGGGELASVGTYTVSEGVLSCTSGGTTTISIEGGTIGDANDYSETNSTYATVPAYYNHNDPSRTDVGHVFGGGKGEGDDPDGDYQLYCNVNTTSIDVSGGRIYGSVFGGAGDAHVLGSTDIDIHTGATIGTLGVSSWDGCVFGGGEGSGDVNTTTGKFEVFKHCGRVGGNTNITMDGGTLMGTIYGGGRVALTGVKENGDPYTSDQNNHGKAIIEVSGGSIGNSITATLLESDFSVGDIFGAGRGDVDNYEDALAGRVANAQITVSGSPTIYGSVFGGGEMAGVGYRNSSNKFYSGQGETTVTINGGSIGSVGELAYTESNNPGEWTIYDEDGKLLHTCTGNVFGGSQGDIDITKPAWVSMGSSKTATVTINGGTIMSGVFGGSEQGTVTGDTRVVIKETDPDNHPTAIGTLVNQGSGATNPYYFGYVHGAGYGSDDDDDNVTHTNDSTNVRSDLLAGRVYGDVYVDVLGGTIKGDVYGGASFAYVGGNVLVNIGSHSTRTDVYTGNATFKGSVYGANNLAGTPLGNVEVNVYQTAHTDDDKCPTIPPGLTEEQILAWLAIQPYGEENFAIQAVYGGSNQADYTPVAGKKATVHVWRCNENTIRDVYGGCNAAHVGTTDVNIDTEVTIDGGRFYRIFGGSNGELVASDIHGTANTEINGGLINQVFGGSNSNGVIDEINLNINQGGSCPLYIEDVFSGGNAALVLGDVVATVECCNAIYGNFYGGTRLANIYGDVIVNIFGATYNNLFAGSMGQAAQAAVGEPGDPNYQPAVPAIPADIKRFPSTIPDPSAWGEPTSEMYRVYQYMQAEYDAGNDLRGHGGNVTLNIFGGTINEAAFGGSDANGNIEGKIQVNVFNAGTTCNLDLENLYGASRNTAYTPITTPGTEFISPEINIIHGTVQGDVFGGGKGELATVTASPKVNMGYYADLGVYGTEGDLMDKLYDTIIKHTPGWTGTSWSTTDYVANVNKDMYGGGELGPIVGNTCVNVFSGTIGTNGKSGEDGNIYGGGKGTESSFIAGRVEGNTKIDMRNGTVLGNIYGGGRLALTGVDENGVMMDDIPDDPTTPAVNEAKTYGNTKVLVKGGTVGNATEIVNFTDFSMGNIYGGGKGYLDYYHPGDYSKAEPALLLGLTKNTEVEISNDLGNNTHVYGIVLGGGELASVGKYTLSHDDTEHPEKITNIAVANGTGATKVTVSGGTIGGDRSQMRYQLAHPEDPTNWYSMYNDDLGYVYGGGEGWSDNPESYVEIQESASPLIKTRLVDLIATVQSTEVKVSGGWVKASVFGGSESGHVRGNTKVTISGGQIGAGDDGTNDVLYTDGTGGSTNQFINPATTPVTTTPTNNTLNGTYHWAYGVDDGSGTTVYNPFDPAKIRNQYDIEHSEYGYVPSDGRSWFGNVFGGGSGWFPYVTGTTAGNFESHWNPLSGKVWGNTEVIIEGGHILNNVYGANESTNVGGTATVTIKGGTIGVPRTPEQIALQPTTSYVFGGGAGDPRDVFDDNTNVDATNVQIKGGIIYGSVFGGAEMGHVVHNATVSINEDIRTTVIGSTGFSGYDGNVFGGGWGTDGSHTAGRVGGNTKITMSAGTAMSSLYGGGKLALTGVDANGDPYLLSGSTTVYDSLNYHGLAEIEVSGGTIGVGGTDALGRALLNSDYSIGDIFGSGQGDIENYSDVLAGRVANAKITVSGSPTIYCSVFGGGEMAGVGYWRPVDGKQKFYDKSGVTSVTIGGTATIGTSLEFSEGYMANPTDWTVMDTINNMARLFHTCSGNIFGGSQGDAAVTTSTSWVSMGRSKDAYVHIKDTPTIMSSVFGGAEQGTLAGNTRVKIEGGTIGKENLVSREVEPNGTGGYQFTGTTGTYSFGNVFGGGYGVDSIQIISQVSDSISVDPSLVANVIAGRVYGNTRVDITGGQIYGNVFGGGNMASTGRWTAVHADPTNPTSAVIDFAPVANTGEATVNVGGTAIIGPMDGTGLNAYVFGGGKGIGNDPDYLRNAYCNVNSTEVTVDLTYSGMNHEADDPEALWSSTTDGRIYGSVYGGGSDGHVLGDTKVVLNGGLIGTYDATGNTITGWGGNIFGSGRNFLKLNYGAGRVAGNTEIEMNNGCVYGAIFGGGRHATTGTGLDGMTMRDDNGSDIHGQTTVKVKGGTVGYKPLVTSYLDRPIGEVYGGGKGSIVGAPGRPAASALLIALVKNTNVEISQATSVPTYVLNTVYGGGEVGTVGHYTWTLTGNVISDLTLLDGTGNTNVTIKGGRIGVKRMVMSYALKPGTFLPATNPVGNVFGGGKGLSADPATYGSQDIDVIINGDHYNRYLLDLMATCGSTSVVVENDAATSNKPWVKGSVYGGSACGHVMFDTDVTIAGGQIGAGNSGTADLDPYDEFVDASSVNLDDDANASKRLNPTYHWDYDPSTLRPFDLVAIYNGQNSGASVDTYKPTDGKTWYGNVFGGGSGFLPYIKNEGTELNPNYVSHWNPESGKVYGNSNVTITGGHILSCVYGGSELADVGDFGIADAAYTALHSDVHEGELYCKNGGTATVSIKEGTVGVPRSTSQITSYPVPGFLYGAGKGDSRDNFNTLTNVNTASVTVNDGAKVYGSVLGGAEQGHVIGNASVLVKADNSAKKPIIGSTGFSGYDGHVFGGGWGDPTKFVSTTALTYNCPAGRVGGTAQITMSDGKVLGNLYGGGYVACVGVGVDGNYDSFISGTGASRVYDSVSHGTTTVEVSGGIIGNPVNNGLTMLASREKSGNVYGGGRGSYQSRREDDLGRAANAVVSVSESPTIYGSVFGGGQLANVGHWNSYASWYTTNTGLTQVTITGTPTIGMEKEFEYAEGATTLPQYTQYETINNRRRIGHTRTGNVFGGGQGEIELDSHDWVVGTEQGHCRTTKVNISMTDGASGGHILSSVFGGSEQGAVWGDARVTIASGTIGQTNLIADILNPSTNMPTGETDTYSFGSVFGGSYGSDSYLNLNLANPSDDQMDSINGLAGHVYRNTYVTITGGTIRGNVFGGGEMASVGQWQWTEMGGDLIPAEDAITHQPTGKATVNVSGSAVIGPLDGTGLNAYVFGGGKGVGNDPNEYRKYYGNVNSTQVTVGLTSGHVDGSLFGGGSDGHVLGNASVTLNSGTIGTNGTTSWDGNIFGGGRDYQTTNLTAGRVAGNITVTMEGGELKGNIFGGGRQALTGVNVNGVAVDDANHGHVTVTVSGGTVGTGTSTLPEQQIYIGHVFGGGKGQPNSSTTGYDHNRLGEVRSTSVTIGGTATVNGSVYGGSENGWVLNDATVNIEENATIGYNPNEYRGNVFGGGRGADPDQNADNLGNYSPNFGRVNGLARVNINGGAVKRFVFGGGDMGIVARERIVNVNGGIIGTAGNENTGDVYGGSNAVPDENSATTPPTLYTGHGNLKTVNVRGGTILGDVYGSSHSSNEGTGVSNWSSFVNITGGTIGDPADAKSTGHVYGAGYEGKVNGKVSVNIGLSAVNSTNTIIASGNTFYRDGLDDDPTPALLKIKGNVFDGSYYYGSGATAWNQYDIEGSSATYLDGTGYDTEHDEAGATTLPYMNIAGGLYGSGTHCESGKTGRAIHVRNYGARQRIGGDNTEMTSATRALTTIQRGGVVLFDNSNIILSGAEDISHQYENYGERKFGLLEVDEGFYMANGSGLVLGTAGSMVLMDSIKEVRSVYLKTGTSYAHNDPTNDTYWELVGIQNSNNHLYRTSTSTGVDDYLSTDDENVILFNGLSKLMVRYCHYDAGRHTYYGALQGFFRMRADAYSINDEESFARARVKLTNKVNGIAEHTAPENTDDGGFLSYDNEKNTFTTAGQVVLGFTYPEPGGNDGGTYYNNTKQYPYFNLSKVSKMGDRLGAEDYRLWALPATLGHKWYVDGRGIGNGGWGKDATHANGWGDYPDKPKKTITGTADSGGICVDQVLNGIGYKFNPAEDIIFVVGPIDALSEGDNLNLSATYPLRLYRYPGGHPMSNDKTDAGGGTAPTDEAAWGGFGSTYPDETKGPGVNTGAMIHANKTSGNFVLNNVEVDGLYSDYDGEVGQLQIPTTYTSTERFNVTKPLVVTAPNGRITLKGSHTESAGETVTNGTILKRGYHNTDASATWYDNPDYTPETEVYHGALYVDKDATVNVEGLVTIEDNRQKKGSGDIECNVYLPTFDTYLNMTNKMDEHTDIGVTSPIRKRNTDGTHPAKYTDNTFSPVAVAVTSDHAADTARMAWKHRNFTDDRDWFFTNGHTSDLPRTTYYSSETETEYPTNPNTVYFGWTWANVVRKEPAAGELGGDVTNAFEIAAIDSPHDLAWLISRVNGENGQTPSTLSGTDVKLTSDIDLNQYLWEPIGTEFRSFSGNFDGQGHLIKNLNIAFLGEGSRTYEQENLGMFGHLNGGTLDRTFVVSGKIQPRGNVNIGGLVGLMEGSSVISNSEAVISIYSPNMTGAAQNASGGLVGVFKGGEIHSSMAMPVFYADDYYTIGGLVGYIVSSSGAPKLNNSFAYPKFYINSESSNVTGGGLVGVNETGSVKNCYARLQTSSNLTAGKYGSLVYNNQNSMDNCFGFQGDNTYSLAVVGTITNSAYFTSVATSDTYGYLYEDNTVTLSEITKPLFEVLNSNITSASVLSDGAYKYARWARPTLSEINGDYPVLMLNNYDDSDNIGQGGFRSMATVAGSTALQYGGTVRDGSGHELSTMLGRSEDVYVYGDVTENLTSVEINATKVALHEDAAILNPGKLSEYANTYVGVTFDNKGLLTSTVNGLARDWHMFSTPLQAAPLGINYVRSGVDENDGVEDPSYDPYTGSGGMLPEYPFYEATEDNDGYFPYNTPYAEYDFYCFNEYTKYKGNTEIGSPHWINFKRNGNSHYYSQEQAPYSHGHIDYYAYDAETMPTVNVNETNLVRGKGYMMALQEDTYLQSHGQLNGTSVNINITNKAVDADWGGKGQNLVGNPFHAYLNFDSFVTGNSGKTGNAFNVYDPEYGSYVSYTVTGSKGGAYTSKYIHPHQGFFVLENEGDDPEHPVTEREISFNPSMFVTRADAGDITFRDDDRPAYPLVNLFADDYQGRSEVVVVEFNRPTNGGGLKIKGLRSGNHLMYAHDEDKDYCAFFAKEGTEKVPVRFKTFEDGVFTMHWNTANGHFQGLYLIDNISGVTCDMLHNDSYTFNALKSDYLSRFYIVFDVTDVDEFNEDHPFAFFDGSTWVVNGTGHFDLIDVTGRVLYSTELVNEQNRVNLNHYAEGVYMMRLSSYKSTQTQKVVHIR